MRRGVLALAVLFFTALVLSRADSLASPAQQSATAVSPSPGRPHLAVLKLWKAKFSEDFIRRYIRTGGVVYDLTTDEMIACHEAGLPETLVTEMLDTRLRPPTPAGEAPVLPTPAADSGSLPPSAADGPARAPSPPSTPAASSLPSATPLAPSPPVPSVAPSSPASPVPDAHLSGRVPESADSEPPAIGASSRARWTGLARRNPGMVLFRSRWEKGTLELDGALLKWTDTKDAGKNLLIPLRHVTEQFLVCTGPPGNEECFEWGFRTKEAEHRFRVAAWERTSSGLPREVYDFFRVHVPGVESNQSFVRGK